MKGCRRDNKLYVAKELGYNNARDAMITTRLANPVAKQAHVLLHVEFLFVFIVTAAEFSCTNVQPLSVRLIGHNKILIVNLALSIFQQYFVHFHTEKKA